MEQKIQQYQVIVGVLDYLHLVKDTIGLDHQQLMDLFQEHITIHGLIFCSPFLLVGTIKFMMKILV